MLESPQLLVPALAAAGSALGILTEQEEADYQRFLLRRPEARAQARAFVSVVEALRVDEPMTRASAETRRDLLAQIADIPQA